MVADPMREATSRASANAALISPDNCGKRIGILIVAYNAVTTIAKVLKRIPADVWENIEEVVVFDDASRDHTYELAVGLKLLSGLAKLTLIKNDSNLGYGGNQKLGYKYFIERASTLLYCCTVMDSMHPRFWRTFTLRLSRARRTRFSVHV